jgi:hypothetical protein
VNKSADKFFTKAAMYEQGGCESYMVQPPSGDAADPAAGEISKFHDQVNKTETVSALFKKSGCEIRKGLQWKIVERSGCENLCFQKFPTLAIPHKRCGDRVLCSKEVEKEHHNSPTLTNESCAAAFSEAEDKKVKKIVYLIDKLPPAEEKDVTKEKEHLNSPPLADVSGAASFLEAEDVFTHRVRHKRSASSYAGCVLPPPIFIFS